MGVEQLEAQLTALPSEGTIAVDLQLDYLENGGDAPLQSLTSALARCFDPAFDPPATLLSKASEYNAVAGCGGGFDEEKWGDETSGLHWYDKIEAHPSDDSSDGAWTPWGLPAGTELRVGRYDRGNGHYTLFARGPAPTVKTIARTWMAWVGDAAGAKRRWRPESSVWVKTIWLTGEHVRIHTTNQSPASEVIPLAAVFADPWRLFVQDPAVVLEIVQALAQALEGAPLEPQDRVRRAYWRSFKRERLARFAGKLRYERGDKAIELELTDGWLVGPEQKCWLPDDLFIHGPPLPGMPRAVREQLRRAVYRALEPGHTIALGDGCPLFDYDRLPKREWAWNVADDGQDDATLAGGGLTIGYQHGHDFGYGEYAIERIYTGAPTRDVAYLPSDVRAEIVEVVKQGIADASDRLMTFDEALNLPNVIAAWAFDFGGQRTVYVFDVTGRPEPLACRTVLASSQQLVTAEVARRGIRVGEHDQELVWYETPDALVVWDNDGRALSIEGSVATFGSRTLVAAEIRAVIGYVEDDYVGRGIKAELADGTQLVVLYAFSAHAYGDYTYNRNDLICDTVWISRIGRWLAAWAACPFRDEV